MPASRLESQQNDPGDDDDGSGSPPDRDTLPQDDRGEGGRQPGQWHGVHNIATDSRGNIYTTETYEGKRIQKFTFKGVKSVTKQYQGTPWPASAR